MYNLLLNNRSKYIVIALILTTFCSLSAKANAQTQPVTQSFRITPAIVDTTLTAGKENKISFKTKNEENGYLKAKCYRATNFWVSYITPDLGKGEKETKA